MRRTLLIGLEVGYFDVGVAVDDLQRRRLLLAAGQADGAIKGLAGLDLDPEGQSTEATFCPTDFSRFSSSVAAVLASSITVSPQPTARKTARDSAASTPIRDSKLI